MGSRPRGPGRFWPGLLVSVTLAGPAGAADVTVPAVPYLPQTDALCGGAAVAMVLRYWGVRDVRAEDFAGSLDARGTGISVDVLGPLFEARGFRAFAWSGSRADATSHLEQGRPLIALLETAPGRHHYVVVLAWANERVLVHDPAVGPYRIIPEREWLRRWDPTGRWALLALPPETRTGGEPGADATDGGARPSDPRDPCAALVAPGVDLALSGSPDAAREQLAAVAAWCPGSPAPVREMAALEFRREDFAAARDLAAEAVKRDPSDRFGWKLLATSRFLLGDRRAALAAWNRIDEPRLDLVQIDGLLRTSTRVADGYLAEARGALLTPGLLRRVERRIGALPAAQLSRVSYRPLSGGVAQLDVAVVERSAWTPLRSVLLRSGMRGISERAIGADVSVLASSGDALRLAGQWQPRRSHAALSASAPRFLGLPGVVTAEASWDEQSYLLADAAEPRTVRERRMRASAALAHWWAADTRAVLTVAADEWDGRGRHVSLAGEVDRRFLGDRVAVGGSGAGWWSAAASPFYAASIRSSVRSDAERPWARIDARYDFASADAPRALWSGAGTGTGRSLFLRARPLLRDGVVEGPAFGRELVGGSAQAEAPIAFLGPARLTGAAFLDVAKVLAPARPAAVDVGVGFRLQSPGWRSALRVDVATPWGSVRPHLSAGFEAEWP